MEYVYKHVNLVHLLIQLVYHVDFVILHVQVVHH